MVPKLKHKKTFSISDLEGKWESGPRYDPSERMRRISLQQLRVKVLAVTNYFCTGMGSPFKCTKLTVCDKDDASGGGT